jgi:3-hydroxyisobutyrate dehydrogenase-like beta-hydroxyacid dehydrogenase
VGGTSGWICSPAVEKRESIGLVGVGLLGTALAGRLSAAGFALTGYDPDAKAGERLAALGGSLVSSPEKVARSCRRTLLSLPAPAQVLETVDRLEACLTPGAIILDTTTGDPELVEATAKRLEQRGIAYLDCEIGGSSSQTTSGEAIVICGGDVEAFERCKDVLAAISDQVFHTGPAGTGTRMKLALNIVIGLHRAVLAETLEFAAANGIDRARALEILKSGPAYSRTMDIKGAKMLARDFTPEARLAQHWKDVKLILKTGEATGARLPLTRVHEALLEEAAARGFGAEDNSAIIKVFGGS